MKLPPPKLYCWRGKPNGGVFRGRLIAWAILLKKEVMWRRLVMPFWASSPVKPSDDSSPSHYLIVTEKNHYLTNFSGRVRY